MEDFESIYRTTFTNLEFPFHVAIAGYAIRFDGDQKANVGNKISIRGKKEWGDILKDATLTKDEGQRLIRCITGCLAKANPENDDLLVTGSVTHLQAKNLCLALAARIETRNRQYKFFDRGYIVYPSYVDPLDPIAEESYKQGGRVGIILDIQGTKALILWDDGSTASGDFRDLVRVDYRMTTQEYDKIWESFTYKDNWSKERTRPKNLVSTSEFMTIEPVSEATIERALKPKTAAVRNRTYRHYWELYGNMLKIGDEVVLFEKYILKVQRHRFEDITTIDEKAMWWARRCAQELVVDFDTEFFSLAMALGFYTWKEAPADKLRYQWQFSTMNNATAWAMWLLAISDYYPLKGIPAQSLASEFKAKEQYIIPSGKGMILGTGAYATAPSRISPTANTEKECVTVRHPQGTSWLAEWNNTIPVFLSALDYTRAHTFSNTFRNKQNHNTHVIQDHSTGSDQREQIAEECRWPLQEARTEDGGGYTSDARKDRRPHPRFEHSQVSGSDRRTEHRQLCSRTVEGSISHKEGAEGVSVRITEPSGGVPVIVSGGQVGSSDPRAIGKPYWAISPEVSSCPACLEESFFAERTSPGASETITYYRCANEECGHTESFP